MRQSREASIREAESRPHWGRTPKPSPRNALKNNRRAPRPKGGEPPPTAADARNKNQRHECKKSNAHDSDAAKPRGVNPPQAESRPHWGRTPKPSPRNAPKNNRRAPPPKGR